MARYWLAQNPQPRFMKQAIVGQQAAKIVEAVAVASLRRDCRAVL
jgi:hypothetical protein